MRRCVHPAGEGWRLLTEPVPARHRTDCQGHGALMPLPWTGDLAVAVSTLMTSLRGVPSVEDPACGGKGMARGRHRRLVYDRASPGI